MNLLSGVAAIYFSLHLGDYYLGAKLIFLGAFFDFFDGFVARALKAVSSIGKELDSLSDIVTFGVAPAAILVSAYDFNWWQLIMIASVPLLSALRLAKFNTDDDQKYEFKGLPTPALAITVASFILSLYKSYAGISPVIVSVVAFALALLLVSPLRMFSLKFKNNFSLTDNKLIYLSLVVIFFLIVFLGMKGVFAGMVLYILLSILRNLIGGKF